jgi:hypothetical protein
MRIKTVQKRPYFPKVTYIEWKDHSDATPLQKTGRETTRRFPNCGTHHEHGHIPESCDKIENL